MSTGTIPQVLQKLQDNVPEQAGDRGRKRIRDTDFEKNCKRRRSPSGTDFSDSESNSDSSVKTDDSESESDQEDAKQHLVSAPISPQVDAKLILITYTNMIAIIAKFHTSSLFFLVISHFVSNICPNKFMEAQECQVETKHVSVKPKFTR